jgi:hypothetical protein
MPITHKRNRMFRAADDLGELGFGGPETEFGRQIDGCEMTLHPLLMHHLHHSNHRDERDQSHEDTAWP